MFKFLSSYIYKLAQLIILLYYLLMAMFTALFKPFSERAWYPEEGMNTKEGKRTKQQPGHTPECIKQVWILIPVMMRGMGQVTREFSVGSWMTFPAGVYHITTVQTGFTIIGRQDIMGTMTIGAFGCLFTT